MFIELNSDEEYRGKKYKSGDTIEVGGSLGERLILNGHKHTSSKKENILKKDTSLSDEEVELLDYKSVQSLIKEYEIETVNKNFIAYKSALKSYFASKKEQT